MGERDPAQLLVELQAVQRVAEDVASSRDLDDVLARCLDHMREAARTSSGAIYLRDERRGIFRRLVARETVDDQVHLPIAQIDAALTGRSSFTSDLEDPHIGWHPAVQAARARGFRLVLNLGMRFRGRVIGLLVLAWRELVTIPEETLRTLEAVMGYQAAAIENARAMQLLERRAQLAQALREFSRRALTTVDEEALYRLIVETVEQLAGDCCASLSVMREGALVMAAGDLPSPPALDDPLVAAALAEPDPLLLDDLERAPAGSALAEMARGIDHAAMALAPLRRGERLEGLLTAGAAEPRLWSCEESEALATLASVAADALERARVHKAEARERRRIDLTLEHLPIGIVVIDAAGRMLHGNRAAREMGALLGSVASSYQDGIRMVRKPDGGTYEMKESILAPALRGELPAPRDVQVIDAAGRTRVIRAVAAPLHDPGQPPVAVLGFSDVSEIYELAAAKDRFLRIASHELRSPVTALRSTAQLFALDPAASSDEGRRRALIERIDRQSARLVKLVTQLLDSARLAADTLPLDLESVDLAQVAREAAEAAGPRVRVVGDAPLRGHWDGSRLEQVLTNLLSNALQYSPPDAPVELRLHDGGDRVRIDVQDRGVGIPREQLPHVFTPFFRARQTSGFHRAGLGLGLHITSEIVRRHGGAISVDSEAGVGTTFTVELPRRADAR